MVHLHLPLKVCDDTSNTYDLLHPNMCDSIPPHIIKNIKVCVVLHKLTRLNPRKSCAMVELSHD